MANKPRNIMVTGLSIQFDGDVGESDSQKAKELARKRIREINELLRNAGDDAQIFGGDDINASQVEIGDPVGGDDGGWADPAVVSELVELVKTLNVPEDALDDMVHDAGQEARVGVLNTLEDEGDQEDHIASVEADASNVNNEGFEGQITFLLERGVTREDIEKELRESVA